MQSALRIQKRALRKTVNARLAQIPGDSIAEQSRAIAAKLLSDPRFGACSSVSCYLSMPSGEIDTVDVVQNILDSGKLLFVPKIQNKEGIMDFLRVYSAEDLASFPSGTWGIKEPQDTYNGHPRPRVLASDSSSATSSEKPSERPSLDVIILPGVAFDRSLCRLGHGKGYYDRMIKSYVSQWNKKPLLIGLGLREQIVGLNQVPMGEYDWKIDLLVTPDEIIEPPSSQPV